MLDASADVIKLRIPRWRDEPVLSGWEGEAEEERGWDCRRRAQRFVTSLLLTQRKGTGLKILEKQGNRFSLAASQRGHNPVNTYILALGELSQILTSRMVR